MTQATPMLRQYLRIKDRHPDAILFFRMGDFYEMFFEDAETAARLLGITLTSRGTHEGRKVPMCGVPYHSAQAYVVRLVEQGRKVAICEQVEDPRSARGIVQREVTRVVTPGSLMEGEDQACAPNVFMAAVASEPGRWGIAHLDLSTGEFRVTEAATREELFGELGRIDPAEVLIPEGDPVAGEPELRSYRLERLEETGFDRRYAGKLLEEQLGVRSLEGFGCRDMRQGVTAAGAIVYYLHQTQKASPEHIRDLVTYHLGGYMFLDETTTRNLELYRTIRRDSSKGTLLHVLDHTVTPMGARLLKRWVGYPLLDLLEIRKRLAAVASLREDRMTREAIREQLGEVYDLERLNGRISLGRANARDLVALKISARRIPGIKEALAGSASELLEEVGVEMDPLEDVASIIDEAVRDEPPVSLKEGGIIREGYNRELDELIRITRNGKGWIADLAATEQERTGINSLKVGYNKVFGYYIEVSKANVSRVPDHYVRKQTLVNGERYITEELKEYEDKVLGAEEKRSALEMEIFETIRERIAGENRRIRRSAELVGALDALASLAETAELNNYVRPEVNDGGTVEIVDGRHPVIEQSVKEEEFVPNDILLDDREQQLLIITGPNMAGKSTILRQTALTVLMAQMGAFVPASRAVIGVVDRIFTRIGASDDLARGQSTFMVEMNETANILRHATPRSLVVLDEIGRGTSTYDGLSIAWAVAEALHDREGRGVRTLFATHYHELTELMTTRSRVKNFNIAVKEWNDRIIFLRKLVPGGTNRSYGIQVARIAGLPEEVIERAREILEKLESGEVDEAGRPRIAGSGKKAPRSETAQLSLFGGGDERLREWIRDLDIRTMTPIDAMNELNRLREYVSGNDERAGKAEGDLRCRAGYGFDAT
ncbi:MAG: DNA mismatch repair protein MutS [Deltaproteobacteria bacterium]|nr:DNA mismatch repair protein MutS [Deltaproteobacteria bacterium]